MDVDLLEQPAHPQDASERAWAEADLVGELAVEVAVAHAHTGRDVSDRPGWVCRELSGGGLAPVERMAVERFWRSQGRLDHVEGVDR